MDHYPILMYHQIDHPPVRGTPMRGMVVSPQAFERQMLALHRLGVKGVSMSGLMPYLRGEKSGCVVGITFDDGYRNNLQHAAPVLQRLGFGSTCYVVSRAIGQTNAWDAALGVPSVNLMDEADLRAWMQAGQEVGSHTANHHDLTTLDEREAQVQIADSKRELESRLNVPVHHFCYPYGRYRPEHARMAQAAGYHSATTTQRGRALRSDGMLELPRVLVAQSTPWWQLLVKVFTRYEDRRGRPSV